MLVSLSAFAGDAANGAAVPAVLLQSIEWNISPIKANSPANIAILMSGIAGIVWMPLTNCWGRMPVLFWSTTLGCFFLLAQVLAPSYNVFYTFKVLGSLSGCAGQTIGLAYVKDMFFLHEQARKTGIWTVIFVTAPFLPAMFGNFIVAKTGLWRPTFWMVFGYNVIVLFMIVVFGDEPFYNRLVATDRQPVRRAGSLNRLHRVVGLWQLKNHQGYFATVLSSYWRLLEVFFKPLVTLIFFYYGAVCMWSVGIIGSSTLLLATPASSGGYGLTQITLGLMFLTPIFGFIIGEIIGYYLNDFVAYMDLKAHKGIHKPESRLWVLYPSGVLLAAGLVLIGQGLHRHLPIAAIIFGWGMNTVGILLASVATFSYCLDSYPSASGEVCALINLARVMFGFSVGYFQTEWVLAQGADVTFGLQGTVVVVASLIVVFLHFYGHKLRAWARPVHPLRI